MAVSKDLQSKFNLTFGYPRSDTRETCDELHMAIKCSKSVVEQKALQSDLAAHQEKAGQGYQSLGVTKRL